MRNDYVLKKITELLDEHNWSLYRLAQESGVSYSTLNNTFHRNNIPSVATLLRVCKGFGITMSEFFDEGGTPFRQLDVEDQKLMANFHYLPKDDKNLVLTYVKGLLTAAGISYDEIEMQFREQEEQE